jgi:hypothetical protein
MQHAINQLKRYRDEKIPMMVVLDDAYRAGMPLGRWELIGLFGAPEVRRLLEVNTGEWRTPPHVEGSAESFHILMPDKNTHVSAVGVNLPKDG